MTGRRRRRRAAWLAVLLLPLLPSAGGGAEAAATAHDLHITYADLAIEGDVVAGRVRLFQDDLERALGPAAGADVVSLRPGPEADALVLGYLREHLRIAADGVQLDPAILDSGRDMRDREAVWWVVVRYRAAAPVRSLHVTNTLFFELFDDQRNVVKLVRFPEQTQRTYHFAPGEAEAVVRF